MSVTFKGQNAFIIIVMLSVINYMIPACTVCTSFIHTLCNATVDNASLLRAALLLDSILALSTCNILLYLSKYVNGQQVLPKLKKKL